MSSVRRLVLQELSVTKQESITQLETCMQQMQHDAASSKQAHQQQAQTLEKQNRELHEIIAATMHTKRASTIKLETAMNALNLSKGNAARFIEVCHHNTILCGNPTSLDGAHEIMLCTLSMDFSYCQVDVTFKQRFRKLQMLDQPHEHIVSHKMLLQVCRVSMPQKCCVQHKAASLTWHCS